MAMLYALMALCLSGSSLAQVIKSGGCPEVEVQKDFEVLKITGRWFEQARFFTLYEFRGECGIFDYVIFQNQTVKVFNTLNSAITGKEEMFESEVITPDPEQSAKMLISIPKSPIEEHNNLWILGTDYDNWIVGFSCNEVCSISLQYAWILTRKQNPDESAMKEAYEVVSKNNLESAEFLPIEQKNCPKNRSE